MASQNHSGSGDNVAGNKTVNVLFKTNKKIVAGLGLLLTLATIVFFLFIKEKTIKGHLSYKNDDPIAQANLQVVNADGKVLHHSKTLTDGRFVLSGLTFFDKNLRLTVTNKNRPFHFNLDSILQINSKEIVLKLPDQIKPYDIKYYNLEGYSVDYLLEGYLKNPNGQDLEKEVAFFRNSVFDNLKSLKYKYHFTEELIGEDGIETEMIYIDHTTNGKESHNAQFSNKMAKQLDFLKKPIVGTYNNSIAPPDVYLYLMSNVDPDIQRIEVDDLADEPRIARVYDFFESKTFEWQVENNSTKWRYTTIKELEKYKDNQADYYLQFPPTYFEFLKHITNLNDPDKFIKFSIFYDECNGLIVSIIPSFLQVQVAMIENISGEMIELNRIKVSKNPEKGLRTQASENSYFANAPEREWLTIPPAISRLKAGESIIIPLFIQFKNEHTFIYDPSLTLHELEANNYSYAMRSYNPEELSIKYSVFFGSCPYVYTWSTTKEEWRIENHIIKGITAAKEERFDTLQIQQFDGRLLIREHDPETSYLNLVSVLGIDDNQNSQQFFPEEQSMIYDDEHYHIMNQGDSILLHFPDFEVTSKPMDFYVVAKGYYLVYQPN